jgi:hypothetical protein
MILQLYLNNIIDFPKFLQSSTELCFSVVYAFAIYISLHSTPFLPPLHRLLYFSSGDIEARGEGKKEDKNFAFSMSSQKFSV